MVGAGAMSGLAVATTARSGAARIVVANRTREHAERLAAAVSGEVVDLDSLTDAIAAADLVISCTGASGLVIGEPVVRAAAGRRGARPSSCSTWRCRTTWTGRSRCCLASA